MIVANRLWRDERGSAVVEFTLVGTLLTLMTVAVIQIGIVIHVRNTVHDAAVQAAYEAALADVTADQVESIVRDVVRSAVGSDLVGDVRSSYTDALGVPTLEVRVTAVLPLIVFVGIPDGLEVVGRAPVESLVVE
ncbi:TadE/TadG family type IV pilus assembly protein [Microbacterium sp. ZW T5_56]|uniref:TadE/TadG family type IV pilus assembly protein n=1 Tax=Microbacterium sp. ZW T5_56 TaxID=3378081 RepID=UPI003853094F